LQHFLHCSINVEQIVHALAFSNFRREKVAKSRRAGRSARNLDAATLELCRPSYAPVPSGQLLIRST